MKSFARTVLGVAALSTIILAGNRSEGMAVERDTPSSAKGLAAAGKRATNSDLSGYVASAGSTSGDRAGGEDLASASVEVPSVTCGTENRKLLLGLIAPALIAGIEIGCQGGQGTYRLAAQVSGGQSASSNDVVPGDVVQISLTSGGSSGTVTAIVVNDTTTISSTGTPPSTSGLLFGTGDLANTLPPAFSKVKFTDCRFGGKNLSTKMTIKYNRKDGDTKIATGKLKKGAFTQKFKQLN